MRGCELCALVARIYCESDQASLCWECDAKVHGANFLVARHARVLLCRNCQSPTPWRAAGVRLSPTVTVCDCCADMGKAASVGEEEGGTEVLHKEADDVDVDNYTEEEEEEEDEDEDEEEEEEEEEEEGENQVVPGAQMLATPVSSSSGEASSTPGVASATFLKRMRENADLSSENDQPPPSCRRSNFTPSRVRSVTDEDASAVSTSFLPCNGSRRSMLHPAAPTSLADHSAGNRIYARRALAAVDLVFATSCSPPI